MERWEWVNIVNMAMELKYYYPSQGRQGRYKRLSFRHTSLFLMEDLQMGKTGLMSSGRARLQQEESEQGSGVNLN